MEYCIAILQFLVSSQLTMMVNMWAFLLKEILLWKLKSLGDYRFQDTENIKLTEIDRYQDYNPVAIYDEVQNILSKAIDQKFVPVTDDQGVFIGIVRRREILEFNEKVQESEKSNIKKAIS